MSKPPRKGRAACSRRHASATSASRSPRRSCSGDIVSASIHSSTSAECSGRYATRRAPTPASAATAVLCASFPRSIASRPVSRPKVRTTNAPAGVVTFQFTFVIPPASCSTEAASCSSGTRATTSSSAMAREYRSRAAKWTRPLCREVL